MRPRYHRLVPYAPDATGTPIKPKPAKRCCPCIPSVDLWTLNVIACVTHFVMAWTVLGFAIWRGTGRCTPVVISYNAGPPGPNANTTASMPVGGPGFCFAYGAFAFSFVCFLAHLFVLVNYDVYESRILKRGVNPWRWNEYSVSASIMVLSIASIVGLNTFGEMVSLVAANASCMFFGWVSEILNPPDGRRGVWLPFAFGTFCQVAIWTAIFTSYGTTVSLSPHPVPWFVHTVIVNLFVSFNCFAIVEILYVFHYIEAYEDKEWWYVSLSLGAKTSLAGIVAGATFAPTTA